jgi:hypothetical protein
MNWSKKTLAWFQSECCWLHVLEPFLAFINDKSKFINLFLSKNYLCILRFCSLHLLGCSYELDKYAMLVFVVISLSSTRGDTWVRDRQLSTNTVY